MSARRTLPPTVTYDAPAAGETTQQWADRLLREEQGKEPPLLWQIERHLKLTGVAPSRWSRNVMHDPRFVFDLRLGRQPRPHNVRKALLAIATA